MSFLIGGGLLLLIVLAMMVFAVMRSPRAIDNENLQGRLEAELANDVAAGVLPAEDLAAARRDLDASAGSRESVPFRRKRVGPWAWLLIGLVVVAGVVIYWQKGNWRAAIYGDRVAVTHRVDGMLAQLQAHLKADPSDRQGWIVLARAKSEMGDYAAAATAYSHAVKLDHEQNPALLARWGEARMLAEPGHPTARERAIFAAVLKSDPDSIRGLWYGGLLALKAGNRALAVTRWQRLLGQNIPAPMSAFVTSRLHALGAPATAPAPLAATSGPSIALTIKIAPALAKQIKPGETLFVYVRNPAGGPPLAAKRVAVVKFPVTLKLDNADAIMSDHGLASMRGKRVQVGAFLSASGKATPAPGAPAAAKAVTLGPGVQNLALTLSPAAAKP